MHDQVWTCLWHRKPLSCINSGPKCISEPSPDANPEKLNIKLSFEDDDYHILQNEDTSFGDDEITFKKVSVYKCSIVYVVSVSEKE